MAISTIARLFNTRRQPLLQQTRFPPKQPHHLNNYLSRRKAFRLLIITLALIAILPPIFFHFKLRKFHQMRLRKCSWLNNPPLVCAHGGDSSKAFPNTMAAYGVALHSQVDCIELDVSRSSDGVLFAVHDRELKLITGNSSSRVGLLSAKEIKKLDISHRSGLEFEDIKVPTAEDALKLISSSVRQVILDAKVGPPSYEKGLARDILSVVERTQCKNCLVWAKSDNLVRDVIKLSSDVVAGYIVMSEHLASPKPYILRMKEARVVGAYHPLIDQKLIRVLHGRKKEVYAWTVDDVDSMKKMLFENVDAIVTGNPTLLQHVMQEIRAECLEEGFSFSL